MIDVRTAETRRRPSHADGPPAEELLGALFEAAGKLPDSLPPALRKRVEKELAALRELLVERRPPRILILGRRGAGKSSLVNALFRAPVAATGAVVSQTGRGRWYDYRTDNGVLEILDTRGLGDATRPEDAEHESAREELLAAVRSRVPDVILFLCKAAEVDSHILEDVRFARQLQEEAETTHEYRPPLVALATHVDALEPVPVAEPPYADETKQENMALACGTLRKTFRQEGIELVEVFPVSTYAQFDDGQLRYHRIWNVDVLVEFLVEELPRSAQVELARVSKVRKVQERLARTLTRGAASVCGALAATPLPVADIAPITGVQLALVLGIGLLAGHELSAKTAKKFLSAMGVNLGAAFVFREVARSLVKLIPGAGHLVSAGVAAAGTWALGEAAILYFLRGASEEEARSRYGQVFARRKDEKEEAA